MFDLTIYLYLLSTLNKNYIAESNISQFNFYFENDFLFDTDKYYTNSIKLEWISSHYDTTYNFGIIQDMYTPANHKLDYVELGDHPYTGRVEFNLGTSVIEDYRMVSFDFGVGYTGRYTFAKETMDAFHTILPSHPIVRGWSHQTPTRLLGRFSISQKNRFEIIDGYSDFISNIGINLSNFQSNIFASYQWRIGYNIPNDFGLYSALSKSINYKDSQDIWSFYTLFGFGVEYIDNDITLISPTTSPFYKLVTFNSGFALSYDSFNFSILVSEQSKRFHTQDSRYFKFATILIGYKF